MNLLPKSHSDFGRADFWEGFFRKRGGKAFEWYGEYGELCGVLHKYIKPKENVLNIGCGNSSLSADLYDVGYQNITNIDISDVVIRQMTEKNAEQRPNMKFIKMDVFQLDCEDNEFGVVLDKGTLDAILTDEKEETLAKVTKMFTEVGRVLRIGGRYICISLAQDHIVRKVLAHFTEEGWMLRICRIQEDKDDSDKAREFHMPVFAFVLTKFRKMPNMKQVLEVAYFDDRVERYDSVEQVTSAIKEMQDYAIIRQQLNKKSQVGEDVSLDLYSAASNTPRYTLHVVDRPKRSSRKFAIFIVPEGREREWLFSTQAGQKQLAETAEFDRLVIVLLHCDHTYGDLASVKDELSAKVLELAPPDLGDNKEVPFLSVGDDINKRTICLRGKSDLSGDFVVEDVDCDNQIYRHLVFLSNDKVVQSAARLKKVATRKKSSKKKTKLAIDTSHLHCPHHNIMVAGLSLLPDFEKRLESGAGVLIVGLGGGVLPVFLHKHLPKLKIDAVDIDPVMVDVARDWFDFIPDDDMRVHVADGREFIKQQAASDSSFDVVMLDVNSHDASDGLSYPPKAFVEKDFLETIKSLLHEGILMINLACRDPELRKSLISVVKAVFPTVYSQNIQDEVNEVLFALNLERSASDAQKDFPSLQKILQQATQAQSKGAEIPVLTEMLESLEVL